MIDPRISQYTAAATRMKEGDFRIEVPIGERDAVGELGAALKDLCKVLEHRSAEMRELTHITEQINAGLILDDILNHVYETFRDLIPYDRIGLSLLDETGRVVRARWARSESDDLYLGAGYSSPIEGSSLERILETGQPRILNDLAAYLQEHPKSESTALILREGIRSSLTCPLVAMGKPVGFLFFSSNQPGTYTGEHVETFQRIAGQLSTIVEKGRLYQQLLELNDQRRKFLGIIAHDLRNPISVIKGYLNLLLQQTLGPIEEDQRQVCQHMSEACESMMDLLNDLLDIQSIEAGKLEIHPMEIGVKSYLEDVHRRHSLMGQPKSIRIALDPDATSAGSAWFDPSRINQVMDNLISNAIKFSHPDTTITLGASRPHAQEVELWVRDEGQGIPPDEQPGLFTEFGCCSVKPTAGEGSVGLGLAICKRIVEAHHGRIWVESEFGVGSTFKFTLSTRPLEIMYPDCE